MTILKTNSLHSRVPEDVTFVKVEGFPSNPLESVVIKQLTWLHFRSQNVYAHSLCDVDHLFVKQSFKAFCLQSVHWKR